MKRLSLPASLTFLLLSGCGGRIDASSEETLKKTLPIVVAHAPDTIKAATQEASKRYMEVYFGDVGKPDAAPEWFVVDHMDAQEFIRYVTHFIGKAHAPTTSAPIAPNAFVTKQYLVSLKLNKELFEKARDQAHTTGLYTVDQFEWGPPKVIPPDRNEHIGTNPITFRIPFTNHTGFDVFHPSFRVVIKMPGVDYPAFDEVLTATNDAPIAPEVSTTVELACCTTTENERLHNELSNAPDGTVYKYALVGLADYGKRNALDNAQFPQSSYDTLRRIDECMEDVEKQGDAWTPETAIEACRQRDELLAAKSVKGETSVKHHKL